MHAATQDCLAQGQYALDYMVEIMPIYDEMFKVEYPLPKLDLLVVSEVDSVVMRLVSRAMSSGERILR